MAGTNIITIQHLAIAYEEAVWIDAITPMVNPFSDSFDASPVEQLLEMAKHIGTASPEVYKPRASKLYKHEAPSAASALAA